MTATVHYDAEFAAAGGPGWSPTYIDPHVLTDDTAAAMALVFRQDTMRWVVIDHQGAVYAEADNPADLAGWLTTYAKALGREMAEDAR